MFSYKCLTKLPEFETMRVVWSYAGGAAAAWVTFCFFWGVNFLVVTYLHNLLARWVVASLLVWKEGGVSVNRGFWFLTLHLCLHYFTVRTRNVVYDI